MIGWLIRSETHQTAQHPSKLLARTLYDFLDLEKTLGPAPNDSDEQ
jgi:hypothetical protein